MSINFPSNPVLNTRWTNPENNVEYIFNGSAWESLQAGQFIQQYSSMKNKVINGDFSVWQRGTSHTSSGYGADRWINGIVGSTCTMSQQNFAPGGAAGIPGSPPWFMRMNVSSVAGADNYAVLSHRIEYVQTLSNRQVTVSFYAKANANKTIAVDFVQHFGTGGSAAVDTPLGKVNIGNTWQRYTFATTVPSIVGKTIGTEPHYLNLHIWMDAGSDFNFRSSTLGHQSGTFDFYGIQVEEGAVATPFEELHPGLTLSLCQRYYYRQDQDFQGAVSGFYLDRYTFPVTMRATPTAIPISNGTEENLTIINGAGNLTKDGFYLQCRCDANDGFVVNRITAFDAEL